MQPLNKYFVKVLTPLYEKMRDRPLKRSFKRNGLLIWFWHFKLVSSVFYVFMQYIHSLNMFTKATIKHGSRRFSGVVHWNICGFLGLRVLFSVISRCAFNKFEFSWKGALCSAHTDGKREAFISFKINKSRGEIWLWIPFLIS